MIGKKYGRLTVFAYAGVAAVGKVQASYMKCMCDCGKECNAKAYEIRSGIVKSCGCLREENYKVSNLKHGLTETGAYKSWTYMRKRCLDPSSIQWKDYGGRGIKIDKSWDDFRVFYQDMGERPEGASLDRIDVNGDYRKENCKWSNFKEQVRNRTSSKLVTYNGTTKSLVEWCEEFDIPYLRTYYRLSKGKPLDEVFSKETRSTKPLGFVPSNRGKPKSAD